jgi:hypothetical protein
LSLYVYYPRLQIRWICKFRIFSWFLGTFFYQNMARFFEQYINFSLFYQNLIKIKFFKNPKTTRSRKVWINRKLLGTLTFEHLLAVNPCGLQAKNLIFHMVTFLSVVHRDLPQAGDRKTISLAVFCWFKSSLTSLFLNFWKI